MVDIAQSETPRPFDGYTYRVKRADGRTFEPCHAMPSFSGNGVIMVVPTVNGEGGGIAGDLRDPSLRHVERIGIHKQSWVDRSAPDDV
jgi:hypothetical protein